MTSWRFEVYAPWDLVTPKAILDPTRQLPGTTVAGSTVTEPKFRHPYKGVGSGQFYLQNDDPALAEIDQGDLVRCFIDDVARFEWIVGPMLRHSVAKAALAGLPSGEKYTQITGLGSKAYGARSPIQPWRGGRSQPKETVRAFDWTSPHFAASGFDLSDWESATALARVDSLTSEHWVGSPDAYPDNTIYWIAGSDGSDVDAVEGVRLIRLPPFELTEDKLVGFFGWCDNEGILYLNGTPILFMDTFHICRYVDLQLTAGAYFPSVFLRNETPTVTSSTNNPTGTGVGIYERTSGGSFVERIYVTNVDAEVLVTPAETPGMPIGYTLRKLLDEAQARGELLDVTPGFTNTTSTNGNLFPATDPGCAVGETFTDYLLALEDAVVDIDMAPGLVLNVYYPKGSQMSASGARFTDGVSLTKLDHELRDDRIDKLFVDYDGGYVEVFPSGPIHSGVGEFSKTLKLSQVVSEDAAARIAEEILQGRDVSSVRFAADIVTSPGNEPYTDFIPGDTVHVDDLDGSDTLQPTQAVTFSVDKGGNPLWAVEFGDLLEPLETVADRAVKRFVATRGATNIHSGALVINAGGGQEYKWLVEPFSFDGDASALTVSMRIGATATRDIAWLWVILDEADTVDHTFTVKVNGSTITDLTSTIAAGGTEVRTWLDIPSPGVVGGSDKITLEFDGGPVRFSADLGFR